MSLALKYGFFAMIISLLFWTSCKTTKEIAENPVSYEELYKEWQIDSLGLPENGVRHAHLLSTTLEFTKEGEVIVRSNGKSSEKKFELKDNTIIDLEDPEQPPQIIEQLNKEQLTLLTYRKIAEEQSQVRLYLSPKNKE